MLGGGGDGDPTDGSGASRILKLRGLPFSATVSDVLEFLGDEVTVAGGADGVHMRETRPGRASGECFVELATAADVTRALAKDKENLGKRYVEVFASDSQEMNWALNRAENGNGFSLAMDEDAGVVKLRGLPFTCTPDDVRDFLKGLAVAPDGINILSDHAGRPSGEAFVHFIDKDSAQLALDRDREKIGHRYIEVFVSSAEEVRAYAARLEAGGGGGGARGGGGGGGGYGRGYGRPAPYDRNDRFGGGGRLGRGPPGPPPYRPDMGWGGRGGGGGGGGGWGRGGGGGGGARGGHSVHMRGLPFKATQQDIAYFFKPVRPVNINILYDDNNRPSGEADVDFECHEDAMRAMRRDKNNMEHRYIELFLNSAPGGNGGGGGGGGGLGSGGFKPMYGRGLRGGM